MKHALPLLGLLVAFSACRHQRPMISVFNGGVRASAGKCGEAMSIDLDGSVDVLSANDPRCQLQNGFLIPAEATVGFWKIKRSALAGPAVSNRVELRAPDPRLIQAENNRALSSGEDAKGLNAGNNNRALTSGEDNKGLNAGNDNRALASGEDNKGLNAGNDNRALAAGQDNRSLSAGQSSAPVLEVKKSIDEKVITSEDDAEYTIQVKNVGEAPLSDVVIVDHLSKRLRAIEASRGGRILPQPDDSDVVVWHLGGLEPDAKSEVTFVVRLTPAR